MVLVFATSKRACITGIVLRPLSRPLSLRSHADTHANLLHFGIPRGSQKSQTNQERERKQKEDLRTLTILGLVLFCGNKNEIDLVVQVGEILAEIVDL